jgi:hypothetical protein
VNASYKADFKVVAKDLYRVRFFALDLDRVRVYENENFTGAQLDDLCKQIGLPYGELSSEIHDTDGWVSRDEVCVATGLLDQLGLKDATENFLHYRVITASTPQELQRKLNENLDDDYELKLLSQADGVYTAVLEEVAEFDGEDEELSEDETELATS